MKQRGCNGLSYTLDFVVKDDDKDKFDEVVEADDIKIYIAPNALLSVLGTEMDFQVDKLKSEFVFNNPNAKGFCGYRVMY